MEELLLPLLELGQQLISRDLLADRLSPVQATELVEYAVNFGREQAGISLNEGLIPEKPLSLIQRHCRIEFCQRPAGIPVYSEIQLKNNLIILYCHEIEAVFKMFTAKGYHLERERLYNIFLLHEFFHFIEYNLSGPVSSRKKITVFKILFLEIKRGLLSLSEITAHAYVRGIIGQPVAYLVK